MKRHTSTPYCACDHPPAEHYRVVKDCPDAIPECEVKHFTTYCNLCELPQEEKDRLAYWQRLRQRSTIYVGIETYKQIEARLADPDCDPIFRSLFEAKP